MNLQPITVKEIPVGRPLPWPLYDRDGFMVFAPGEQVLENHLLDGLFRDADHPPEIRPGLEEAEGYRELPPEEAFPPAGIKPQIWERLQLRHLGRNVQGYYLARLIGYIRDSSLLITAPTLKGRRVVIVDGERVEVRMLTGRNIYVFESAVQRVCSSPSPYLHLEYPARVLWQKLRQSPWARTSTLAFVTNARGEKETARITNLSFTGAKLSAPRSIGRQGKTVRLSFKFALDELETVLSLDAVIRHAGPAKPDEDLGPGILEYGVEFKNLHPDDRLWLKCLVYQRIAEGFLI